MRVRVGIRAGVIVALAAAAGVAAGCKSTVPEPVRVLPAPPVPTDRKVGWILRLEQQRTLRDPGVTPAPAAPDVPRAQRLAPAASADLEALALDPMPAIRARAVLAIGRVGMADGLPALRSAMEDADPVVRASAAFALGLLGSADARPALETALGDASIAVRVAAVQAIGLIGDASAASSVASVASACAQLLPAVAPDDEAWPKSPEIELCRESLFTLARLRSYDALARVALDAQGQPVSRWWPVAYALQRAGDPRAGAALLTLATTPGVDTAGFALRGLAAFKTAGAEAIAATIAGRGDQNLVVRVAAIRALAQVGGASDVRLLLGLLNSVDSTSPIALETIATLGALRQPGTFDVVADFVTDRAPAVRAAAMAAAARIDPDAFLLLLTGLGRDRDWSVRAALAGVLASLPPERVTAGALELAGDDDARVHGPALEALAALKAPGLAERLQASLVAPDFVERATAARLVGDMKIENGAALLAAAYARGDSDSAYDARLAAVEALAKFGGDTAKATWRQALTDREWPVRVRAAALLATAGETAAPAPPAPLRVDPAFFESAALLHPAYSPHAFIDTRGGSIEIQLDVVDAPLTSQAFIAQARSGFFNGMRVHRVVPGFVVQAGDPRGDGNGGPGYTQRDELSDRLFVRGTVGMALAGPETGGSQWFITLTPQPHLDGKYTVFGQVVGGWDVLDRIALWDVIDRVRIWDGVDLR